MLGPQVGYFAPQILMEEDLHGPGIDARGAAFPGSTSTCCSGRGRDYAWRRPRPARTSSTPSRVQLCDPDGGTPTVNSKYYVYKGQCLPIEVLTRTNSWHAEPRRPDAGRDATR